MVQNALIHRLQVYFFDRSLGTGTFICILQQLTPDIAILSVIIGYTNKSDNTFELFDL